MNQAKEIGFLLLKVAAAYAVIAAFQTHVKQVPVVGKYLPGGKA